MSIIVSAHDRLALSRAGRPGNFVRIGRGEEDVDEVVPELVEEDSADVDKRTSPFVRIGKASRFVSSPSERFFDKCTS